VANPELSLLLATLNTQGRRMCVFPPTVCGFSGPHVVWGLQAAASSAALQSFAIFSRPGPWVRQSRIGCHQPDLVSSAVPLGPLSGLETQSKTEKADRGVLLIPIFRDASCIDELLVTPVEAVMDSARTGQTQRPFNTFCSWFLSTLLAAERSKRWEC
jgi:hypothetical protein